MQKIGKLLQQKLTAKKFSCCPLGKRLIGTAMIHVPKLAPESAEKSIPLFLATFLADLGIEDNKLALITKISPSAATLKQIMIN